MARPSTRMRTLARAMGMRVRPWRWRWLVALVQVIAVALSMQLTGGLHILADVAFHEACGDCSDDGDRGHDGDDEDCPPGCPTCHTCAHAQAPYVPRAEIVPGAFALLVLRRERPQVTSPPRMMPGSVFRPPRA